MNERITKGACQKIKFPTKAFQSAQTGRIAKGAIWKLKDSVGMFSDLITIKSGKRVDKKEITKSIKVNLEGWMRNPWFEKFRKNPMDLAIVVKMNKYRFRHQDVDNVVKIVLDALKKNNTSDSTFLFEDDSQVARLLVWKMEREEDPYYNTDQLIISFRAYDSTKQMEMVNEG
uniref:RusA family crossover junction endodeoxyribonuclease n=1 Tax=candidate division WOR-3 bacterium TaxID=2052148 RepID=A0A7V3NUP2_UNCW3